MNYNLCIARSVVIDATNLNLTFFTSFGDRVYQCSCCCSVRNLRYHQSLFIELRNFGSYLHLATTSAVVISTHVNHAAGSEIRIKFKRLITEISYGSINEFVEVVRQNLHLETNGDTHRTLSEQERELDRKRNRFFVTSVVREFPFCGFRIIDDIESKF